MPLAERHWLGQDVEAGAHEVDVEHAMVPHHAEDALVEITCLLRREADNDASGRVSLHHAFSLREGEQIVLIGDELESGRQVAVVKDIEHAIGRILDLHLAKVHRLRGELHIVANGRATAAELQRVPSVGVHSEVSTRSYTGDLRRVVDRYRYEAIGAKTARCLAQLKTGIFAVVLHPLNLKCGRHQRLVLNGHFLGGSLSNQQVLVV